MKIEIFGFLSLLKLAIFIAFFSQILKFILGLIPFIIISIKEYLISINQFNISFEKFCKENEYPIHSAASLSWYKRKLKEEKERHEKECSEYYSGQTTNAPKEIELSEVPSIIKNFKSNLHLLTRRF